MESRRVELVLLYQDVDVSTDIAGYLIDFSFGDNGSGQADDLQVKIEDRLQLWQGEWMGKKGDRMQAFIKTINWNKENTTEILPCGEFDVDNIEVSGPPDELSIKGVSVPVSTGGRNEKVTKAWEKVTLQRIAKDIAAKSGLSLMYLAKENPTYDRIDQTKQANLAFIQDLAIKEGLSIKVTNKKLVIYDDELLEKKPPVKTIVRGKNNVLSYAFGEAFIDCTYQSCEVSYYDSKKKKTYKYTYKPKGAPKNGPVLKINQRVTSTKEAQRLARKSLKKKNQEANKGRLSLVGDVVLVQGVTVELKGWSNFDGKYFIEKANHRISNGGYTVDVEVRKVLNY
ncbi:phage late control D family protein [Brevibacillus laterosporus]|uniref:phage late control D family protein n=1 Tax=Brevibacillus laterosporus TaxID=1465 RepID=UPI0018CEDEEE|nr:contractile injection system protein, VgrG/Pvc8 family [Brevibacillus laterosporus]MBG9799535.1 hypothetical protein [Brevibacillus laterosporus]MED1909742.1 contractile injection system protein, VgrG/Pvc8 family [Brevibacillus laterosporus]